jgi:hypothetical protein
MKRSSASSRVRQTERGLMSQLLSAQLGLAQLQVSLEAAEHCGQ